MSNKKVSQKSSQANKSSESKDNANSESDIENKPAQKVVRKLTRSSSTRKSKHLTGMWCLLIGKNLQYILISFSSFVFSHI